MAFLQKKKCFMRKSAHHHHHLFSSFSFLTEFYIHMERFFPFLLLLSNNSSNPHHTIIKRKLSSGEFFFYYTIASIFFPGFNSNGKKNIIEKKFISKYTFLFRSAVFVFHLTLIVFCSKTELFPLIRYF